MKDFPAIKAVSPFWKLLQRRNISQEDHHDSSALRDSVLSFFLIPPNKHRTIKFTEFYQLCLCPQLPDYNDLNIVQVEISKFALRRLRLLLPSYSAPFWKLSIGLQEDRMKQRGKYLLWVATCLAWAAHHFLKFYHLSHLVFLKVTNQL